MGLAKLLATTSNAHVEQSDKIFGVVVGIVKDIKDPRHLGRIKVDFPWLADAKEESADAEEAKAHSYWARIASFMAGKNRGAFFIPEVGDEVLVAFEHGYINRPMILGGLWSVDDPPPEQVDKEGKNDLRAIYSRSGHKIILNDSSDKPSITIVDKTGENSIFIDSANNAMDIKVKGDLTINVGGNMTIATKGKIEISADNDATVNTKTNLKITAGGSGDLKATSALNVKSDANIAVAGNGQTEVKGTTLSLNGSAMTEVKGGLVKIN